MYILQALVLGHEGVDVFVCLYDFMAQKRYYRGKISQINTDNSYDITFDDGDERQSTPLNEMQYNQFEYLLV